MAEIKQGRWTAEIEKMLPGTPPRPVIKSAYLETSRDGEILAAGVLLTDPGHGGAGAGYRNVPDGKRRLDEAVAMLSGVRSAQIHPIRSSSHNPPTAPCTINPSAACSG